MESSATPSSASLQKLAEALTGFGPEHMTIAFENCDYAQILAEQAEADAIAKMLGLYDALVDKGLGTDAIATQMLDADTHPDVSALARAFMKLLYLGYWFAPDSSPGTSPVLLGGVPYENGLVWKAMQTHPTALSNQRFGSWASPPPPLSAFIK